MDHFPITWRRRRAAATFHRNGGATQLLLALLSLLCFAEIAVAEPLQLQLRYQVPTASGSDRYHTLNRDETWSGKETALIVCDVWDTHNCKNAALRVAEMAPRLNRVVAEARNRGVTIIHAPSNCMDFYAKHPARERAKSAPAATNPPEKITQWCYQIPAEEQADYPIDQSNGGCDDDPAEHEAWQASLAPLKKEKKWPWRRQHNAIKIDPQQDFISDRGDEVWNILEARDIQNVIMTGVHTNMCVLGRPFGLRRLVTSGKNVVLMRDMTDTMYDPESEPYVSHFTGTDLIVSHIERHVCPTVTSVQVIGGKEFRFQKDRRPHVAIVMAEKEYRTAETLPKFAIDPLGQHYRVSMIFANPEDRNDIPGLEAIQQADALLISVRRRVLPKDEIALLKKFVSAGKPVIGIRTASHAFALRRQEPPEGYADWPEFDAQVFGGNYHNHYGNSLESRVRAKTITHPILKGLEDASFLQGGSLYKTSPLRDGTITLMTGQIQGHDPEPVAWTFQRADGGRSFYTSLGHIEDFENPVFRQLLLNGIEWALQGDSE